MEREQRKFGNRTPYNVFRRVFRMFTNTWEVLMLIVISTSGEIIVQSPEIDLDPSRLSEDSNKFLETFRLCKLIMSIRSKLNP